MITGAGNEHIAVEAMKLGVCDYIVKDVGGGHLDLLPSVIEQVLQQQRLAEEKQQAEVEREQLWAALGRSSRQLQTAAEVSHAASSILDPDELIQQVVNLVRERFELYYVGLFLVDRTGEWSGEPGRWAVLRAGTGQAGQQMMEQGHKLEISGASMIGWCVANKQSRVALDVGEEAIRFENPLLPETRSEVALPLISRGEAIGAMSIQSCQEAAFSRGDISVLQAMADQLANAIENARLYDQAQRELAERKRAEEVLHQNAAELEARNEELDAFAHTVAHDLKTPLTVIRGFSMILEQDCDTMSEEKLRRHLHTVVRNGHKMNNIIDELLLLSSVRKMEEVELGPLDMAGIVAEAKQRHAYMIEERQAEIILPQNWPVAMGYGPWIEEVWVNYLSNAIKYGGRPPRVELGGTEQTDGMVRFWVRDNGPGLTPEEQGQLFTLFTRLDRVRTQGHGLGLSIVQRIVIRLGGQVGVESQVGRGSVFAFTLPGMKQ
jgi:signal transduction histidine kinase